MARAKLAGIQSVACVAITRTMSIIMTRAMETILNIAHLILLKTESIMVFYRLLMTLGSLCKEKRQWDKMKFTSDINNYRTLGMVSDSLVPDST